MCLKKYMFFISLQKTAMAARNSQFSKSHNSPKYDSITNQLSLSSPQDKNAEEFKKTFSMRKAVFVYINRLFHVKLLSSNHNRCKSLN